MKNILKYITAFTLVLITAFCGCSGDGDTTQPIKESDVSFWSCSANEKILADMDKTEYESIATDAEISVFMAKGEYESGQIIISPSVDVPYYNATVSDLTLRGGTDKIEKENIDVYKQIYIDITLNFEKNGVPMGKYPDGLVPMSSIVEYGQNNIEKNTNQGIYVTFESSLEQTPGIYEGSLSIDFKSFIKTIPISAQVYNLEVSEEVRTKSTFRTATPFEHGELNGTQAMLDKYTEALIDFRLAPSTILYENNHNDESIRRYVEKAYEFLINPRCSNVSIPYKEVTKRHPVSNKSYLCIEPNTLENYLYAFAAKSFEKEFNLLEKLVMYNAIIDEARISLPLSKVNNKDKENDTTGNENYIYATFNRSYEKLSAIGEDFEYVSAWVYFETEQDFSNNKIRFCSWAVYTPYIEVNKWQEVKISKDMIFGSSTWSHYYPDDTMDAFWKMHAVDGTNERNFLQVKGLEKPATIYFDSISLIKATVSDYVEPKMGEEFTIPSVSLYGVDGSVAATSSVEKTEVHFKTNKDATISEAVTLTQDGKFTANVGFYTIKYTLCGKNEYYVKEISFTVEKTMAANMLEDFDDAARRDHLFNRNQGSLTAEQKAIHGWLESYTDKNDLEKTGVVKVCGAHRSFWVKFNKTIEELTSLGLDENDTISITFLYTEITWGVVPKIFGVTCQTVYADVWNTVTVSVGDIITANGDLQTFYSKVEKDAANNLNGTGYETFYLPVEPSTTVYLADITFTKNA